AAVCFSTTAPLKSGLLRLVAHSGGMSAFDPNYLLDAVADRTEVEWFSPAAQTEGVLAGPADIYLRTGDGVVTWGWSVEPVPVDPGTRRFRRFRHPEGWALLTEADDPESILLSAPSELHVVTGADGAVR